jgi:hypothetical protein
MKIDLKRKILLLRVQSSLVSDIFDPIDARRNKTQKWFQDWLYDLNNGAQERALRFVSSLKSSVLVLRKHLRKTVAAAGALNV